MNIEYYINLKRKIDNNINTYISILHSNLKNKNQKLNNLRKGTLFLQKELDKLLIESRLKNE